MSDYLGVFFANGIVIGCIYALIALGFNVIYTTTGVINFAQGEFVVVGGLTTAWLCSSLSWPLYLAAPAGIAAAALVGLISYYVAIRPARNASPVSLIILTIALSIVLKSGASFVWGTDHYTLPKLSEQSVSVGKGTVDLHAFLIIPISALMMLVLAGFFRYTVAGLKMRACASDRDGARLCGVSPDGAGARSFTLGAALAGAAGVVITPMLSMLFDSGTMLGLKGFSAAILGGLGNPVGCVVGGLIIGVLEQFITYFSSGYKDILALAIVVILLLIRPKGIVSR